MKTRMKVIITVLCAVSISGWSQSTVTAGAPTANEPLTAPVQVRAANGIAPLSAQTTTAQASELERSQANDFHAQAAAGRVPNGALWTVGFQNSGARQVGDVSVVCFDNPDPKTLAETSEDLSILSYLLGRNLERAFATDTGDSYKLGIPMVLTSQGHSVDATYIQGFGVLLKMQVRFPLMPLPENQNPSQPPREDSEWDQARRALETGTADSYTPIGTVRSWSLPAEATQEYNPKLVELLKRRVLELLKNATNVRHLDTQDWILVEITGAVELVVAARSEAASGANGMSPDQPGEQPASRPMIKGSSTGYSSANPKYSGSDTRPRAPFITMRPENPGEASIMTIRVKKSAIDDFAKGALTEDQFLKKVEVATYLEPKGLVENSDNLTK